MTKARYIQVHRDLKELRRRIGYRHLPQIDEADHDLEVAWSAECARLAKRSANTAAAITAFCESV